MKVLITGAHGQVGRALVTSAPAWVEVQACSRSELDVTDADKTARAVSVARPDLIINAAAYTAVDRAESEPELARLCNVGGVRHLSEAARTSGARLLHLSTDFVFDGNSSRPYCTTDAVRPLGVYGRTKAEGEAIVAATLPRQCVILRTAWVYGPEGQNFVRTMLRLMAERGNVRVVSDQIGAPTSTASLVKAIWRFAERSHLHGIYHWTDSGVASWYDFAVAISEEATQAGLLNRAVSVIPIVTHEYPTPARRPQFSVLDCRESVSVTSLVPVHWRTSLRATLGEMKLA